MTGPRANSYNDPQNLFPNMKLPEDIQLRILEFLLIMPTPIVDPKPQRRLRALCHADHVHGSLSNGYQKLIEIGLDGNLCGNLYEDYAHPSYFAYKAFRDIDTTAAICSDRSAVQVLNLNHKFYFEGAKILKHNRFMFTSIKTLHCFFVHYPKAFAALKNVILIYKCWQIRDYQTQRAAMPDAPGPWASYLFAMPDFFRQQRIYTPMSQGLPRALDRTYPHHIDNLKQLIIHFQDHYLLESHDKWPQTGSHNTCEDPYNRLDVADHLFAMSTAYEHIVCVASRSPCMDLTIDERQFEQVRYTECIVQPRELIDPTILLSCVEGLLSDGWLAHRVFFSGLEDWDDRKAVNAAEMVLTKSTRFRRAPLQDLRARANRAGADAGLHDDGHNDM